MTQVLPVIVILGAAVWEGGNPSPSLQRRINHAVKVYHSGKSDLIIASGGLGKFPPSEAQVMFNQLVSNGIPKNAILLEDKSTTTFENAAFSILLAKKNSRKSVIVITDRYHILRAEITFWFMGMSAKGMAPKNTKGSSAPKRIWFYIRECIALPVYFLRLVNWKLFNGVLPLP